MSESGKFIVVFKDSATQEQIDEYARTVDNTGGQVKNRYNTALKGFSATLTPENFQNLQGDSIIDYIEPDGEVTTQ